MVQTTSLIAVSTTPSGIWACTMDEKRNISQWVNEYPRNKLQQDIEEYGLQVAVSNLRQEWKQQHDQLSISCAYSNVAAFSYSQGGVDARGLFCQSAGGEIVAFTKVAGQENSARQTIVSHGCLPGTALALATSTKSPNVVLIYQRANGGLYYRPLRLTGKGKQWALDEEEYIANAAPRNKIGVACLQDLSVVNVYFQNMDYELVQHVIQRENDTWVSALDVVTVRGQCDNLYRSISATYSTGDAIQVYLQENGHTFALTKPDITGNALWNKVELPDVPEGITIQTVRRLADSVPYQCIFWYDEFSGLQMHLATNEVVETHKTSTSQYVIERRGHKVTVIDSAERLNGIGRVRGTRKVVSVKVNYTNERVNDVTLIYSGDEEDRGISLGNGDLTGKSESFTLDEDEELAVLWVERDRDETRRVMFGTSFARTSKWYGLKSNQPIQPQFSPGESIVHLPTNADKPEWARRTTAMNVSRILSSLETSLTRYRAMVEATSSLSIRQSSFIASPQTIVEDAELLIQQIDYIQHLAGYTGSRVLKGNRSDPEIDLNSRKVECRDTFKRIVAALQNLLEPITTTHRIEDVEGVVSVISEFTVLASHIELWRKSVADCIEESKNILQKRVSDAKQRHQEAEDTLAKSRLKVSRGVCLGDVVECDVAAEKVARQWMEQAYQLQEQANKKYARIESRFAALKDDLAKIPVHRRPINGSLSTSSGRHVPQLHKHEPSTLHTPYQFAAAFSAVWNAPEVVKVLKDHLTLSLDAQTTLSQVLQQGSRG